MTFLVHPSLGVGNALRDTAAKVKGVMVSKSYGSFTQRMLGTSGCILLPPRMHWGQIHRCFGCNELKVSHCHVLLTTGFGVPFAGADPV